MLACLRVRRVLEKSREHVFLSGFLNLIHLPRMTARQHEHSLTLVDDDRCGQANSMGAEYLSSLGVGTGIDRARPSPVLSFFRRYLLLSKRFGMGRQTSVSPFVRRFVFQRSSLDCTPQLFALTHDVDHFAGTGVNAQSQAAATDTMALLFLHRLSAAFDC